MQACSLAAPGGVGEKRDQLNFRRHHELQALEQHLGQASRPRTDHKVARPTDHAPPCRQRLVSADGSEDCNCCATYPRRKQYAHEHWSNIPRLCYAIASSSIKTHKSVPMRSVHRLRTMRAVIGNVPVDIQAAAPPRRCGPPTVAATLAVALALAAPLGLVTCVLKCCGI